MGYLQVSVVLDLPVYVGRGTTDARPILRGRLTSLVELADFLKQAAGIPKGQWYFLSADLSGGYRSADTSERVYALIIDVDHDLTLEQARSRLTELGHPCIIYTSASHRLVKNPGEKSEQPPCDRFRIVMPLARPVKGDAWVYLYGALCNYVLNAPGIYDKACSDPSRLWYAAQHRDAIEMLCEDGEPLAPNVVAPLPKVDRSAEFEAKGLRVRREGEATKKRPGDDYESSKSWFELLSGAGCRFLYARGVQEYWQRPGKSGPGNSLATNYRENGKIHVFSSSMSPLEANENYSKFAFYAAMRFGDLSDESLKAAARELGKLGYGTPPEAPFKPDPLPLASIPKNGHIEVEAEPDPLVKFEPTDLGNAERFIRIYGKDLRYCHLWGRWVLWNGHHWITDENGGAIPKQKAVLMVRGIAQEAFRPERVKDMGSMLEWSGKCHSRSRLESIVALAKSLPGVPITPDELDRDPELLNLRNGTLNLRTFEFRPHSREDLITKMIDVEYDPEAKCPNWLKFLDRVLASDFDLLNYIQKAVGYTMTGFTSAKCFFFLHGRGNNGKTIFVETLTDLLGDYAKQVGIDTLMVQQKQAQTNDLAALKGARMVASTETENGKALAEGMIKKLTGFDTITCRFLNQEFFSYRPEFTIWLSGNHKPRIRGTDEGIWSRVHLIPFEQFIPPEERIKAEVLIATFKSEMPGILAWAIQGCRKWQVDGLEKPKAVQDAVDEYREESDLFGEFLEECTEIDQFGSIRAKEFYGRYFRWAKQKGEKDPMTGHRFGKTLGERGERKQKDRDGTFYEGRTLKAEPQNQGNWWSE